MSDHLHGHTVGDDDRAHGLHCIVCGKPGSPVMARGYKGEAKARSSGKEVRVGHHLLIGVCAECSRDLPDTVHQKTEALKDRGALNLLRLVDRVQNGLI